MHLLEVLGDMGHRRYGRRLEVSCGLYGAGVGGALRRDMRDWQEQTGEQIVADVFDAHPQAQGAYRFDLRQAMPQYSNRVQWEDDWNFVHRSLEEAGVFGRFEQAEDGKSHTLVLMDDVYFVPQLEQKTVRFILTGLREEVEGFTQWKEQQQIQSAKLTTRID
ncbi:MAG: type VI secretion system tip protein VgrG, partial [Burkholderiales bacterium]|nr:type VI secretion system tip protein VgrG [Burkholderiales bacterium]